MRFGGHQTFTIRDGWLHKGLELLVDNDNRNLLVDDTAFDHLGVGKNMAQSINHWLLATGLAEKEVNENGKLKKDLIPTSYGETVWKYDPFFLDKGTWWTIHINLVHKAEHAASWDWFFNKFTNDRFQKQVCLQGLNRYETLNSKRSVSLTTLERDVSCFLNTYSKDIPSRRKDPEDEIDSPLKDLGLLTYYRNSDYYQVNTKRKIIPSHVMLYALSKINLNEQDGWSEISFFDLLSEENNPGRIFALSNEDLFEEFLHLENDKSFKKSFSLQGLAGERIVRVKKENPMTWLKSYYERGGEQ